jgi:heat-inducible transcriptional repressor
MLDERARTLLKTLIERYIADGQPVGSRALSKYSGLDLSAATVRNVMADLEDLGFIASPHTSAGRVPTPRGYRFFVDSLLTMQPLEAEKSRHRRATAPLAAATTDQQRLAPALRTHPFCRHRPDAAAQARRDPADRVRQPVREAHPADPRHHRRRRAEPHPVHRAPLFASELVVATNYLNQYFAGHDFEQIRNRVKEDLLKLRGDLQDLMAAALAAGDEAMRRPTTNTSSPANATCSKSRSCPPT